MVQGVDSVMAKCINDNRMVFLPVLSVRTAAAASVCNQILSPPVGQTQREGETGGKAGELRGGARREWRETERR